MEAPEKIYIHPDLDSIFGITERSCESEIEYTRTDAFIEKAAEWLDDHIIDYMEFDEYSEMLCGFDTDRMIKDFKNYMKGEVI